LSLQLTKRRRFLFFVFGIIAFIIAYSVGAILVKINASQADFIKKDFETKIKGINQYGIFANNFKVALGMFIPGFGIALGGFSAFSTGLVFNAIAQTSPALSNISPLIVFLTPFGILEIIAYGIAISRSGILSYQLIKDIYISQYSSTRKTRSRYTDQGRRARRIKSNIEKSRQNERRCYSTAIRPAYGFDS
jgi:hypothetical protein